MSLNLDDLEKLKTVLLEPMIESVRADLNTHLAPVIEMQKAQQSKLETHDNEIGGLKSYQKKALVGWGVFATGFGIAWGSAWGWIKGKFHFGG